MKFDLHYMLSLFAMRELWLAALTVIELSALSWILAVLLGFPLACARLSRHAWLSIPARLYIWFFRSVPLLVAVIVIYNLPQMLPATGPWFSHPFFSGTVALVLTETAYMAEIHRGGLSSVARGQHEAAYALGLRSPGVQRLVIIPQALRVALPTLANQYIACVKLTSLISVISLGELLLVGQQLYAQNLLVMETLFAITVYYVGIVTLFGWIIHYVEKHFDLQARHPVALDTAQVNALRAKLTPTPATPCSASCDGLPALTLSGLHKRYGDHHVLKGIDLQVRRGEVVSIIGPSGSGKTSLIRTINALEALDDGEILLFGEPFLAARNKGASRARRDGLLNVGMVFQSFNLFPHRTIVENVMLAPRYHRRCSAVDARAQALGLLDKVGLLAHSDKYPYQLSGGQQQRVAIARALAMEPAIMLFDEPTSALDPELVGDVLKVISALADEGMTMLIVTHEMDFAMTISDRVVFMEDGMIQLAASPDEIRERSDADRIRRFIGGDQKVASQRVVHTAPMASPVTLVKQEAIGNA
ncbi:glutamate transport ATP-binding protein GluA [Paraburkholderia caribensis MBA4]|uniref:Glutamate transport ATP-binding protein GluA n=1 Tax=Paraburkholderia caribensis MBA4 TaxID=1323664 RepID=A0A0P0RIK5_9BURK|nr:amino acid ABC transporter permease/ATP-binding protein [Paraburkholderia caribensis]ALL68524.1 glutamate transport ATP-binding protein GluA [Paraburkholderia caribensis MBA4]